MVVISTTLWCPYKKAADLGKRFIELATKVPIQLFEKQLVLGAGKLVKGGFWKLLYIVGVKAEKYDEAMELILKRLNYYAEVEGVEYEVETLQSVRKLLQGVGLKMPK
jgi:hypothetical protein